MGRVLGDILHLIDLIKQLSLFEAFSQLFVIGHDLFLTVKHLLIAIPEKVSLVLKILTINFSKAYERLILHQLEIMRNFGWFVEDLVDGHLKDAGRSLGHIGYLLIIKECWPLFVHELCGINDRLCCLLGASCRFGRFHLLLADRTQLALTQPPSYAVVVKLALQRNKYLVHAGKSHDFFAQLARVQTYYAYILLLFILWLVPVHWQLVHYFLRHSSFPTLCDLCTGRERVLVRRCRVLGPLEKSCRLDVTAHARAVRSLMVRREVLKNPG
eukprot:TRINITY_DN14331_c0_g1_i4.p1 TRINITY_DN14331_c0_g1~~TRINITY_DN14331_c0_g1_i4.p1  ORF type:complete len:271 (+),score=-7.15 TRINITY_DN14331_c0_g1_i4:95-907(+)